MKNIKHCIWDFDGTIMDTYPGIVRCFKKALADVGVEASDEEIMQKLAINIPYALKSYTELYGIEDLSERFTKHREATAGEPIDIIPGAAEALARVREIGGANYIFTNRGESIYPLLESAGLSGEFVEIVTSVSPEFKIKPAPDSILYLMKKYGGTAEDTVMIGDRMCDLESGYGAECKTMFLVTPLAPIYPKCDWCINNFDEMLELLK